MDFAALMRLLASSSAKPAGMESAFARTYFAAAIRDFELASEDLPATFDCSAVEPAVLASRAMDLAKAIRGSAAFSKSFSVFGRLDAKPKPPSDRATLKTEKIVNAQRYFMLSSDKTGQQTELLILASGRSKLQLKQINLLRLIEFIIKLRI